MAPPLRVVLLLKSAAVEGDRAVIASCPVSSAARLSESGRSASPAAGRSPGPVRRRFAAAQ